MTSFEQFFSQATFYTDDEPYVVLKLPARAITAAASVIAEIGDPFCALIVDKDEVTLVVPHEAPEEFGRRLQGYEVHAAPYRLITLDVVLPSDLVGFMAAVSAALAAANVTILPYAAYSRDHLLVPEAQFEAAIAALRQLQGAN